MSDPVYPLCLTLRAPNDRYTNAMVNHERPRRDARRYKVRREITTIKLTHLQLIYYSIRTRSETGIEPRATFMGAKRRVRRMRCNNWQLQGYRQQRRGYSTCNNTRHSSSASTITNRDHRDLAVPRIVRVFRRGRRTVGQIIRVRPGPISPDRRFPLSRCQ